MAELDREPRGDRGVAAGAGEAVATLMCIDGGIRVELVASGETRSLEPLRRLLERKRGSESSTRFAPGSARQRLLSFLDRSIGLVRSRERNDSADVRARRCGIERRFSERRPSEAACSRVTPLAALDKCWWTADDRLSSDQIHLGDGMPDEGPIVGRVQYQVELTPIGSD